MFIGLASVTATTIVKSSREHAGIKSAMKKSTPTTLLHYRWETKVKQFFLATDEMVALHAMHTDIQPGRVVMKQRPLLVTLHLLKNRKIPQRTFSFKLMCYREPRSLVHPSERLLADGWHSEQRAPNPL